MRPVFIGGCSRSGTTLLGAMIGAHSQCLTVPESQFKVDVYRSLASRNNEINLRRALELMLEHWRFRVGWHLDIKTDSISDRELGTSYSELIEWIVRRFGAERGRSEASIWVDHTPSNIRYATTLSELFPETKWLHIVRDGRAVACSVMPLDWGPNTITGAARWWAERLSYGLAVETSSVGDKIFRVRYEDLVGNPEETLKSLCSYLEIDFQPSMADGTGFQLRALTSRAHSLIGKRPDVSRANAWEKSLPPRQIEIFENITCDLLQYLGYELKYKSSSRCPTRVERFRFTVQECLRREIINRYAHQRRIWKHGR